MAYTPDTLRPVFGLPGFWQAWVYLSPDNAAAVNTAGYIADAGERGMAVNDLVIHVETDAFTISLMTVKAISSGAANLTDGLSVGVTDTD